MIEQDLIIELILRFTPPSSWSHNKPHLICKLWSSIFLSESFAKMYYCDLFSLSVDDRNQLEQCMKFSIGEYTPKNEQAEDGEGEYASLKEVFKFQNHVKMPDYSKYWNLLKEYTTLSCLFPLKLKQFANKASCASSLKEMLEISKQTEALSRQLNETGSIRTKLNQFFQSSLIIDSHTIDSSQIQKFMRGITKDVFITAFKALRPCVSSSKEGGCEIGCVVYLSSGFPLHMTFSGNYSCFEGDATYFEEYVKCEGCNIFWSYECYTESYSSGQVGSVMGIHLDMDAVHVPEGLDHTKVCSTILYYWFSVFLLGKRDMMDTLEDNMNNLNFDSPEVYCPSLMRPPPVESSAQGIPLMVRDGSLFPFFLQGMPIGYTPDLGDESPKKKQKTENSIMEE